jgi:hypothetical protein
MLARDFIRLVALNPRFAVTEQQIIAKIFSDPSIWLSGPQAAINIELFQGLLDERAGEMIGNTGLPNNKQNDNTEKNEIIKELKIMRQIRQRLTQFKPTPGTRMSSAEVANVSDAEFLQMPDDEYLKTFGVKRPTMKDIVKAREANEAGAQPQTDAQKPDTPETDTPETGEPTMKPTEMLESLKQAINDPGGEGFNVISKMSVQDLLSGLSQLKLSEIQITDLIGELSSKGVPSEVIEKAVNKRKKGGK